MQLSKSKLDNNSILTSLFVWITVTLLMVASWLKHEFGNTEFEQILYHLQFGADGLAGVDINLYVSFIKWCILSPIVIAWCVLYFIKKINQPFNKYLCRAIYLLGLGYFFYSISIVQHLYNSTKEDYIAKNYVEPINVKLLSTPKNLILLYVESLENTYSDPDLFSEDLLRSLHQIKGVQFGKFRQANGTSWTIAAMVSTMCGIPLRPRYDSGKVLKSNGFAESSDGFLPNAICLSDILKDNGYKNIYIGGASHKFAGKGMFLKTHGYEEIIGSDELAEEYGHLFHNWGLYDDDLFNLLKKKVDELEQNQQPYNLTALTLDTHHPNGNLSKYCRARGGNDYKAIVECTAELVQDFVNYLDAKGYLRHTQVVILGDHLSMKPELTGKNLGSVNKRTVYNKFVLSSPMHKNREEVSHFDLYPTILYALGFTFPNNKLALGMSGFGYLEDPIDENRFRDMNRQVMGVSSKYVSFWKSPYASVAQNLTLDPKELPAPWSKLLADGKLPQCLLFLQIKNDKMQYVTSNSNTAQSRSKLVLDSIRKIIHNNPGQLPEGYYLINVGDIYKESFVAPILSFTANATQIYANKVVPFPDYQALAGYAKTFTTIDSKMAANPWSQRMNKIFWRGSATGGSAATKDPGEILRLRLLQHVQSLDYVDAGITKYPGSLNRELISKAEKKYPVRPFVPVEDSLKFKYMFDVDGHSSTFERMAWLLYSNSVIFKVKSPNVQWYYSKMQPGVHYLEVKEDFSNLEQLYTWAEANPKEAEQIAQNARNLAKQTFTEDAIQQAVIDSFVRYQQLLQQLS